MSGRQSRKACAWPSKVRPIPRLAQLAAAGLRAEADAADRARAERDEAGVAEARRNAAAIMAAVERIAGILGVPAATAQTGENGQAGMPSRALALSLLCRVEADRLEETDTAGRWVSWQTRSGDRAAVPGGVRAIGPAPPPCAIEGCERTRTLP